jgi:3-hydroxyisobutyrate dehydrogenase-like beta-hydroxyacid dehydrogenase
MGDHIGIIGIGLVGTALSENLIKSGFLVYGYDISGDRMDHFKSMGGIPCNDPIQVAEICKRVILCLMTSQIVENVIFGENGLMKAEGNPSLIIDTTTGDPEETESIAQRLRESGVDYLDATISGSSLQIRAKKGVFMVGGNYEIYRQNLNIFEAICISSIYTGPSGSGVRAKLLVNLVMGLNRVALAEGLVFAENIGIPLPKALELCGSTFAYSRVIDMKGEKMITGDHRPGGKLVQHQKDVNLILKYAKKSGQLLPMSQAHLQLLNQAVDAGEGDLDNSVLIDVIRRCGIK